MADRRPGGRLREARISVRAALADGVLTPVVPSLLTKVHGGDEVGMLLFI